MQNPSGDMGTTSPGRPFTGEGDHGLGWTLTDVPDKEAITIPLSAEVERAMLEFVAATSERMCEDVTAAHPAGTALLDIANTVREVLAHGRGCAVVSGLSPGMFSQTEMQRDQCKERIPSASANPLSRWAIASGQAPSS